MGRYTNCTCDHCKRIFADGDDIVICPVCGAPQHRACYNAHHACPHEAEHAAGYEWHFPAQGQGAKVACGRCGAYNDADAKACRLCGAPLGEEGHTLGSIFGERGSEYRAEREQYSSGQYADESELNGPSDFTVDEVTSKELESYVGTSAPRLLRIFRSILQGSRGPSTWSIPGFIFGPFYLLYRRVRKPAYLLMLVLAAIHIPSFFYSIEAFKAYVAPEMLHVTLSYSTSVLNTMAQLSNAMVFLRFVLHCYCGFSANRFILNTAIDDICDMHTRYTPEEQRTITYHKALFFRGRPTLGRPLLWALCMLAISYAVIYALVVRLIP